MKISNIVEVLAVGAVMLGLFVVGSVITPKQISGNQIRAGCSGGKCDGDHNAACAPVDPRKPCSAVHTVCYGNGGKDCVRVNRSCFGTNCGAGWDYACL